MITDENRNTAWKARAMPFGEVKIVIVEIELNIQFTGHCWGVNSALTYNSCRDCDSELGRYIQSDPNGLVGASTSYGILGAKLGGGHLEK